MTRFLFLTSLFSILSPIFAESFPEPVPLFQSFDAKYQAIENSTAPGLTHGGNLFKRVLTCDAGYGYCSSNGGCCLMDEKCCVDGCGKPGSECCSVGGSCPSGWFCCGTDGCAPNGGECCGDGGYCDAGNICVKVQGYVRDQCCTDLKCTAYYSGGASHPFNTGGSGSTKTSTAASGGATGGSTMVTTKPKTTAAATASEVSLTQSAAASSQTGISSGSGSGSNSGFGSGSSSTRTVSAATGTSTSSVVQQTTSGASKSGERLFIGVLTMVGAGMLLTVGLL